jgi:hypothetical protein
LNDYEKKLAEYQTKNATSPSNTPAKNKNLSVYEEKLQQLQTAQNLPKKETPSPVRLGSKGNEP